MRNPERIDELEAKLQREIAIRERLEIELKKTESKHNEAIQSTSERMGRYQALVKAVPDAMFVLDSDGIYLEFISTQGFETLYPPEDFLGKSVHDIMPSDIAEASMHCIKEALRTSKVQRFDYDLRLGEERRHYEARVVPTGTDSVLAVVRDTTELNQSNEKLRTTQEYLDTILLNLPVGIAILEGPDFRYYRINHRLAEINGLSVEDHLDRPLAAVLPDAAPDIIPGLRHVLETGEPRLDREFSTKLPKDPEVIRHFIDSFFPIKGADGKPRAVGAVVLEITSRKQAEEALQKAYDELELRVVERTAELSQSNETLQQEIAKRKTADEELQKSQARLIGLIDVAADAIISIDESQRIVLFNRAAEQIFGYAADDVTGQSLDLLIPPRLQTIHREHIAGFASSATMARRMGERMTINGRRNNGEEFPAEAAISKFEVGGQAIFTVILRDITEREQTEAALLLQREELAHVQRISSMGELTAAFAHEINQPLTAILSNAQAAKRFMKSDTPDLRELSDILDDIIDDNRRAAEVIKRLRTFLKKQPIQAELRDINAIVNDVVNILKSDALIRQISVTQDLAKDLPPILCDHVQIQQVLLNLIINSFDAMEGNANLSTLTIRTALENGLVVQVSVEDTGVGFDDYGADQVFKPFQTSKSKGMGIGLTISRTIVEAHNGTIWAEPNQERGSTVYFTLPVSSGE